MSKYRIHLLGRFYLSLNEEPVTGFRSDKVQALLAYLAIEGVVPVARKHLSELLWWGYVEHSSRLSLRQALHNLNQIFAPLVVLRASRQTIQIDRVQGHLTCDLWEVQSLLTRDPSTFSAADWKLLQASSGAELLDGLALIDSAPFKLWLEKQRFQHKSIQRKIANLLLRKPLDADEPTTAPSARHNLRRLFTPFFGRQKEIEQIMQQVYDPEFPLIVLLGEGGAGKTRLSLAVAQQIVLRESRYVAQREDVANQPNQSLHFPDGVWFIPLSAPSWGDPASVIASAIVKELGLHLTGTESIVEQIFYYFEQKSILLIFDNFESVFPGRSFILDLLQRSSHVKIIITSRQRLNLQAESIHKVKGLPIPAAVDMATARHDLQLFPGLQLFVDRAKRTTRGFELTDTNYADVIAICAIVHGNPLAIELAASQIEQSNPRQILTALQRDITELATDLYDVPAEHRSIRTVLDQSWKLLNEAEMKALALCTVFQYRFSAEAAASVLDRSDYLQLLQNLVDKSWLNTEFSGMQREFTMHAIVRDYGSQKLINMGIETKYNTHQRHCDYYLHFVSLLEAGMSSARMHQLINSIRQELANVQSAWRWAVLQGQYELISRSCIALCDFYIHAGLFREGALELELAVETLQALLSNEEDLSIQEWGPAISLALSAHAMLLHRQGEIEQSIHQCERAIQLAEKSGSLRVIGISTQCFVAAKLQHQQREDAQNLLQYSLQVVRQADEKRTEARCFLDLGALALLENRFEAAKTYYDEGVILAKSYGFPDLEIRFLKSLGEMLIRLGNISECRTIFEQAIQSSREIGSLWLESMCLAGLGIAYDKFGDYPRAHECYRQALNIFVEIGDRNSQARILGNLGISCDFLGDYTTAITYSRQCLQLWRELNGSGELSVVLVNLSIHHFHTDEYVIAEQYAREALVVSSTIDDRYMQRYAWVALGYVLDAVHCYNEALAAFQRAFELSQELNVPFMKIEPLAGIVKVATKINRSDQNILVHVTTILGYITEKGLESLEDPFQVLLNCYQYLKLTQNPLSIPLLEKAHNELMSRAANISDESQRASFLNNVITHQQILSEWKEFFAHRTALSRR